MCPSLVEIRSVTSEIRRRQKRRRKEETTVVKYKPFGIAMPCGLIILLYGLEACPLTKNQLSSIDFVVNRFFMKLFKSSNIAVINECQKMFYFQLPSKRVSHRTYRFLSKVALRDNNFIKYTSHV